MTENAALPLFSLRRRFADWPNPEVPRIAAGVYAIWEEDRLIYCGMSGRAFKEGISPEGKTKYGLFTRLASHASGRLSGDQFCVYVANRLVIPNLTAEQLPRFAAGSLTLDALTKAFIHEKFEYQFAIFASGSDAFQLEKYCREGHVFGHKPLLNPA